jgi:VanZ family protein
VRKRNLRILTILWIIGILFPMAFLGKLWPSFGSVFDAIFEPNWMHILMHGLLYAIFGFLLTLWVKPTSIKAVFLLLGLSLLVGILHESLQLLTAHLWPGLLPELFDLGVDLAGAAFGIGIGLVVLRRKVLRKSDSE